MDEQASSISMARRRGSRVIDKSGKLLDSALHWFHTTNNNNIMLEQQLNRRSAVQWSLRCSGSSAPNNKSVKVDKCSVLVISTVHNKRVKTLYGP
jgi:hypothetical protein